MAKVNVAGDYATLKVGDVHFYYGYEHVWCKAHNVEEQLLCGIGQYIAEEK